MIARRWIVLGFFLAVLLATLGVWHFGYVQALDRTSRQAEASLALAADRLVAGLRRYQEMSVLLADHPSLVALATGQPAGDVNGLLLRIADTTAALDLAFVGPQGQVLASAQAGQVRDVAGSPAFQRALQGALGRSYGTDPVLQRRVYELAAPSFSADGQVQGVVLARVALSNLELEWSGAGPPVFFTDANGKVVAANRLELRLSGQRPTPLTERIYRGHQLWTTGLGPYISAEALHLSQPLPVLNMQAETLVDAAPARRIARLQAAIVAVVLTAFAAFLFLALERRRVLAIANQALEAKVSARTAALTRSNQMLRQEIQEREEAEAALHRAQADLVQAGKLSALGQMSAGISHELNQPLMAIQQFAANGARFLDRAQPDAAADNLGRIEALSARMARIIHNLRAFARNENEPMGRVDITQVIDSALELTGPRLRRDGVALDWAGGDPVWVRGGGVRLSQVMVNLITNACDAMAEHPGPAARLTIAIEPGTPVRVMVSDTGPGIAEPERLFDPFYSTKQPGAAEGLGLGLSISYGLVQSFGGQIRGTNTPEGARFTVELDPWPEEDDP